MPSFIFKADFKKFIFSGQFVYQFIQQSTQLQQVGQYAKNKRIRIKYSRYQLILFVWIQQKNNQMQPQIPHAKQGDKQKQQHFRQLLRNIQCKQLYKYLTPVKQRRELGYIESCCGHVQDILKYTDLVAQTVGLDCEMVMTSKGPQICQIVITDLLGAKIYNELFGIQKNTHITDLLTHITGISQQDYNSKFAHKPSYGNHHKQIIQQLIKDKVVVGHDLSNDLALLNLSHQAFIDTVALLPHHFGLPLKNKLKDLALQILRKHIQWGNHDPFQDCLAALEIVKRHIEQGRGTIEVQPFPIYQYCYQGVVDYLIVLKHAQLRLDKVLFLVLRGSRALGLQINHAYKSDWDFVVVYDTYTEINAKLIKLPQVDITIFDQQSFQKHLYNNDISYYEIFFMGQKFTYIKKIQLPLAEFSVQKMRASLGFHLNKSRMKIKRFYKQKQTCPYYEWKILKAQHLQIRFIDLFSQLFQAFNQIKTKFQGRKQEQDLQQNNQIKIDKFKYLESIIDVRKMNAIWKQTEQQFIKSKNFDVVSKKLQRLLQTKTTQINQIYKLKTSLRYKQKQQLIPSTIRKHKMKKMQEQGLQQMEQEHQKRQQNKTHTKLKTVRFLRQHPLDQIEKRRIIVKRHKKYNNLVQLHYMQSANFQDQIARQCRGLILDESSNFSIVALPYYKFFDYNDPKFTEVSKIDWQSAKVYDKKDGSIAFLYYYANKWNVASSTIPDGTNRYCFARQETSKQFGQQFWSIFYSNGFELPRVQDKSKTFVFQLLSKDHIIVVKRDKSQIVLHGVRDAETLEEEDHEKYENKYNWTVTKSINIPKEELSLQSIVKRAEDLDPLKSEGFVICDKNWVRVKVKSSNYLRINWLGQLNLGFNKDPKKYILIQIILSGEAESFCQYCPEWKAIVQQFLRRIKRLNNKIIKIYQQFKDLDKKQFASKIEKFDKIFRSLLFAVKSNPQLYYGKAQTILQPKNFYNYITESVEFNDQHNQPE